MKPSEAVESGWCQGAFARTQDGIQTLPGNESARSFCALGATFFAPDDQRREYRHILISMFAGARSGVAAWNDDPNRTKQEVVDKLRQVERILEEGSWVCVLPPSPHQSAEEDIP